MPPDFYNDLAPIYDRMIPWDRRLAREAPWFEELWRRTGARRVLDASTGSGGHLPLFVHQGLQVTAADASASMLALARRRVEALPEDRRPRIVQASWHELPDVLGGEQFDVVLCLGNSLPYVTETDDLERALAGMYACIVPGGVLLLQYRNFLRHRIGGERLLPTTFHGAPDGSEDIVVRVYDWHEKTVDFNVLDLHREPGGQWTLVQHVTPLRLWSADVIIGELCGLGAHVRLFGSLGLDPFSPEASDDIVLWATRPKG